MKKGHIDISNLNTPPEQAEFETAKYLAASGKDVTFIRPSSTPNQHTPDIMMDGIEWEIKCPEGNSKRTIENNMRKAITQSNSVIFDLRHMKLSEKQCIAQPEQQFNKRSQLKRLLIIKKNGELLTYPKKH
jgi:hypothetical protein